jgi:Berberine and berberine like
MAPLADIHLTVDVTRGEGEDQIKAACGAHYQRLVALKHKYDATDLFHLNQNIKPTA